MAVDKSARLKRNGIAIEPPVSVPLLLQVDPAARVSRRQSAGCLWEQDSEEIGSKYPLRRGQRWSSLPEETFLSYYRLFDRLMRAFFVARQFFYYRGWKFEKEIIGLVLIDSSNIFFSFFFFFFFWKVIDRAFLSFFLSSFIASKNARYILSTGFFLSFWLEDVNFIRI